MILQVDAAAEAEMAEAASWYAARSRTAVAGLELEVNEALARIVETPARFPVIRRRRPGAEIRRALIPSYPYAIVFTVLEDSVRVIAFPHLQRKPFYWLRRVTRSK